MAQTKADRQAYQRKWYAKKQAQLKLAGNAPVVASQRGNEITEIIRAYQLFDKHITRPSERKMMDSVLTGILKKLK